MLKWFVVEINILFKATYEVQAIDGTEAILNAIGKHHRAAIQKGYNTPLGLLLKDYVKVLEIKEKR